MREEKSILIGEDVPVLWEFLFGFDFVGGGLWSFGDEGRDGFGRREARVNSSKEFVIEEENGNEEEIGRDPPETVEKRYLSQPYFSVGSYQEYDCSKYRDVHSLPSSDDGQHNHDRSKYPHWRDDTEEDDAIHTTKKEPGFSFI